MASPAQVIDFQQTTGKRETRRMRDLPDHVLKEDPYHESTVFFSDASGYLIAGT